MLMMKIYSTKDQNISNIMFVKQLLHGLPLQYCDNSVSQQALPDDLTLGMLPIFR